MDKQNEKEEGADGLAIIQLVGIVLFAGPFAYGLVLMLLNALSHTNIEGNAIGALSFCGFIFLVYAAIKQFQRGLRGKKKKDEISALRDAG